MSDIFHEVDEEVRREQLQKLWDRYGHFFIAACILVVLGVGAWRGYQWWETKKAVEASANFDAAAQLVEQGKPAEAEAAFAQLAREGAAGYRNLARLREAAVLAERDPKAAVAAYDAIARDSAVGQPLQDLASVRAGLILVDTAPLAEMTRRLEPPPGPARLSAIPRASCWRCPRCAASDAAAVKRWAELIDQRPGGARRSARPCRDADDARRPKPARARGQRWRWGSLRRLTVPRAGVAGADGGRCDTFDSLDLFDSKKKLPGERKPVFPEGVPGVSQGVPRGAAERLQRAGGPARSRAGAPPRFSSSPTSPNRSEKPKPKQAAKPKPKPKPRTPPPEQAQAPPQQPQQAPAVSQAPAPWPAAPQQQPQAAWPTR